MKNKHMQMNKILVMMLCAAMTVEQLPFMVLILRMVLR